MGSNCSKLKSYIQNFYIFIFLISVDHFYCPGEFVQFSAEYLC